jgi:GT2 family glycosyltransferase
LKPRASVIIPTYRSRRFIAPCLDSLERQTCRDFEVLVLDSGADGTAELIREQYPWVTVIVHTHRQFPGEARNAAVLRATADLLVFLDSDCVAGPDFMDRLLTAHQSGMRVFGAPVRNGNPESFVGWATYFVNSWYCMPAMRTAEPLELPSCALAMDREMFETYGPFPEGTYSEDTVLSWRMKQSAVPLSIATDLEVYHTNETDLGRFVSKKLFHGSCFARVRCYYFHFSPMRRAWHALTTPALPLVLFFRMARAVQGSTVPRWRFWAAAPLIVLVLIAWSAGEMSGYLRPGKLS